MLDLDLTQEINPFPQQDHLPSTDAMDGFLGVDDDRHVTRTIKVI